MESDVTTGHKDKAISLDLAWHFNNGDGTGSRRKAIEDNNVEAELELQVGDIIKVNVTKSENTFALGRNQRTGQYGIFPISKTKRYFSVVKFPTYDKVIKTYV